MDIFLKGLTHGYGAKMVIFEPKPWVNPFGKMSTFRLYKLLTAVKVSVLKRFSRFKMCAHVENSFFLKSLSLIDCRVQECGFNL